jgi:hypothetical protein
VARFRASGWIIHDRKDFHAVQEKSRGRCPPENGIGVRLRECAATSV